MTTTADRLLEDAKRSLARAIEALMDVVVREVDGYHEFTPEYRKEMARSLGEMVAAKGRLTP